MIQIPDAPAVNPASGQICAMLALDIAGFTRPDRDEEVRIHIHKALYEILREALQRSGLPWDRCHHEDRGDGALVVAPPDIPAHGIIDPFPERLRSLIRVHNRMSAPAARIQVRAAAHIGPVYRDDHGLVGDDINMLFRMLDAKPVHAALAGWRRRAGARHLPVHVREPRPPAPRPGLRGPVPADQYSGERDPGKRLDTPARRAITFTGDRYRQAGARVTVQGEAATPRPVGS